jgi:DNA replication protein DnaC
LFGLNASGKTFFYALLCNLLVKRNYTVAFIDIKRFLIQLKSEMPSGNIKSNLIEKALECDFLFIDDLGNELVSA